MASENEFQIENSIFIDALESERGVGALKANTVRFREAFRSDQDIGHLWKLRDGRAVSLRIFRTWDEARAAAGVLE